jgi:hypothetical protein
MISTIEKPFSYIVPLNRFPSKTIVYDIEGKEIKVVNEVALNEIIPKGLWLHAQEKKYGMANDQAATLYLEALDEGNPTK